MKKLIAPVIGASVAAVLAVGFASAATPSPTASVPAPVVAPVTPSSSAAPAAGPAATSIVASILGLSNAEIMGLRQQGLSLAQIAERQKVDPQRLIDALVAQWSARIDARLAAGAITADQAKTLKANLTVQAKAMVNQTALGGMRGAAVGAGPNGTMRGMAGGAAGMGAGRGGMMRGAGAAGCPVASTAPSN